MNTKDINKWWHKGINKERARLTNTPKPHKGDKTSTPTDFSNFAPSIPRVSFSNGVANAKKSKI